MTDQERRMRIAQRAVLELQPGDVVNIGVGLPTLVPDLVPPNLAAQITLQSENGVLGVGPRPEPGQEDPDLVNASKQPITVLPGGSFFDSTASFAMVRGGHITAAILGALEVSETGDIANWTVPGGNQLGVGGAMDLVSGAGRVIVTMPFFGKDGQPKVVPSCTLPITARREVDKLITDLAVFSFANGQMYLDELAPEITLDELRARTPAQFIVREPLQPYQTSTASRS